MARKQSKPGPGGVSTRGQWRPHNALSAGVASREGWAKTAGKGSRNPRGGKRKKHS